MKKSILITTIVGIILIIAIGGIYIYLNPETPEPTTGEFITTLDLDSFCNLQEGKACNIPMPCEGEKVDVIGYTKWNDMELRGLSGNGMARTRLPIIYFDSDTPQNWEEYYELRDNFFWAGITISEDAKTEDSSESARIIKEKLTALGVADDEPLIIKVKNAKIIGYDMPTMSECSRGVGLQASYKDITFEKIN